MSVGDAVSDEYSDYINGFIGEGEAASLLPNGNWVGSLTQFNGNKGYWFKVNQDFEFNFEITDDELVRSTELPTINKYPEGMEYVQSMNQAFYFIEDIIIDGNSIDVGSWVLAYNNNILVGARQWNGKYTDIPAMGYDNSIETAGYLNDGDQVRLEVIDLNGDKYILSGDMPTWENNQIFHTASLTNIDIPDQILISSIYPNPFNPTTNIQFGLNEKSDVHISIYDVNGRFAELLINNEFSRGLHNITWDASDYPSGIYFVRIISDNNFASQKLILMK